MADFLEKLQQREKHVHKYQRFKTPKGTKLWKCMLSGCNHSFYNDELLVGRETICWLCGDEFKIEKATGKLSVKPVCSNCWKKRKQQFNERVNKVSKISDKAYDNFEKITLGKDL